MNSEKTIDSIPIDLFHEIFSRLPTKLVGRCRCVSKQWASILGRQDFTQLFLSRSSTRPRLLFASKQDNDEWLFFSLPQNTYEKSTVVFHTKFHRSRSDCIYASGLFYFSDVQISKRNGGYSVPVICNPLTGRYAILPKLITDSQPRSFFGFDPVDKQFKVLLMNGILNNETVHHILTLGAGKMRWRKIQCPFTHKPYGEGICINGVLYCLARPIGESSDVIVCCDVRSEKFKYTRAPSFDQLINYKGKLGGIIMKYEYDYNYFGWRTRELCMWVLEDVEKQEWSECVFRFPDVGKCKRLSVVGMTATSEIVLWESLSSYKYYVIYFSPERNTFQKVFFQGRICGRVYAFVDHIDDLSLNGARHLKSSNYDLRISEVFRSINKFDALCRLDDDL